jgi:RNase P/RNase MRP subunit POP5
LVISVQFSVKVKLEPFQLQALIQTALRNMYGQVGGATLLVDVLDWRPNELGKSGIADVHEAGQGLLRTDAESAAAIWAALSVLSSYDSKACRVLVQEATSFLPVLHPLAGAAKQS